MSDLIERLRATNKRVRHSQELRDEAADALEQLTNDNKWAGEQLMKKDKLITELTDLYNVALADNETP